MILFFDTETTSLPIKHLPVNHPAQPHLVQLAALLVDEDGTERASLNLIIEPDVYEIPAAASDVHGITTELARRWGVPLSAAVWPFVCMRSQARLIVAHNIKFDLAVMEDAIFRLPKRNFHPGPSERFCTMERSAPIVNLPPTDRMLAAGIDKPKPPKLEEAYRHFFGEELVGAHDALADVRACKRIYFELIKPITAAA